jgi:hypothetical protein
MYDCDKEWDVKPIKRGEAEARAAGSAGPACSAAVECEIVDCWTSSRGHTFLKVCIPPDRRDACNAFGEAMVEKRNVTVLLPNAPVVGRDRSEAEGT